MKLIFLLVSILSFCYGIDIKFSSLYSNGIKRIEVSECREEPCALIKGQPLKVKITFETTYPKEQEYKDVKDVSAHLYLNGYRNRYIWTLERINSLCKNQPKDCPLVMHKNYTMDALLTLSVDIPEYEHSAFGSRNGKSAVYFNVVMESSNGGTVIGEIASVFDIQSSHKKF